MTAIAEITLPPFEPDKGEPLEPPPPPPPEIPDLPPRRRRKPKTDSPPQDVTPSVPVVISDEDKHALAGLLTTGFGVFFEIIASRRGDHWRLTKDEAARLGNSWAEPSAPFLAKHSQYVPWAVALLATSSILLPRLQADSAKLENAENADATV